MTMAMRSPVHKCHGGSPNGKAGASTERVPWVHVRTSWHLSSHWARLYVPDGTPDRGYRRVTCSLKGGPVATQVNAHRRALARYAFTATIGTRIAFRTLKCSSSPCSQFR